MKWLRKRGASSAEYALIAMAISVASVGGVYSLGIKTSSGLNDAKEAFSGSFSSGNQVAEEIDRSFPPDCFVAPAGNNNLTPTAGQDCYDIGSGVDTFDGSAHPASLKLKAAIDDSAGHDDITTSGYGDYYEGGMRTNLTMGAGNDLVVVTESTGHSSMSSSWNTEYKLGSGNDVLEMNVTNLGAGAEHIIDTGSGNDKVTQSCATGGNPSNAPAALIFSQDRLDLQSVNCIPYINMYSGTNDLNLNYSTTDTYTPGNRAEVNVYSGASIVGNLNFGAGTSTKLDFRDVSSASVDLKVLGGYNNVVDFDRLNNAANVTKFNATIDVDDAFELRTTIAVNPAWNFDIQDGSFSWAMTFWDQPLPPVSDFIGMPLIDTTQIIGAHTSTFDFSNYYTGGTVTLLSAGSVVRTIDVDCGGYCPNLNSYTGASLDFDTIVISDGSGTATIPFNSASPNFKLSHVTIRSK